MTNQVQNLTSKKYDLADRTAKFGEAIIEFAKRVRRDPINEVLLKQL